MADNRRYPLMLAAFCVALLLLVSQGFADVARNTAGFTSQLTALPPAAVADPPQVSFSATAAVPKQATVMSYVMPEPTTQAAESHGAVGSGVGRWRDLVSRYFGANTDAALRVMQGESRGNPGATSGSCRGLFQIHSRAHASKLAQKAAAWGMENDLYDPEFNVRFAAYMSAGGTNWSSWTCQP